MTAYQDPSAIFSPSIARRAAFAARDWSYVDAWLASKLPSSSPSFERNPDTLSALLSLAALNETADEERALLARAEAQALDELASAAEAADDDGHHRQHQDPRPPHQPAAAILAAVESRLTRQGHAALDAMGRLAAQAGLAYASPADLARRFVATQADLHSAEQSAARVAVLQHHIRREIGRANALLASLQSPDFEPPPELARQNIETQRRVNAASAHLPDARERLADLSSPLAALPYPTVDDVAREEREYLAVLSRKKELDAALAAFAGLPGDLDLARSELETVRRQLRGFTQRRDEAFEDLVERESPARPR